MNSSKWNTCPSEGPNKWAPENLHKRWPAVICKNVNKNGVDTLNGQPYPLFYLTEVICINYLGSHRFHIKISDSIISDMLSLGFLEKVYQNKFLEYLSKVLIDGLDTNKAAQH